MTGASGPDELATTVTMGHDNTLSATDGGVDYNLVWSDEEFVIAVPSGQTSVMAPFTLSVVNDDLVEGNEEIRFQRLKVNGEAVPFGTPPETLKILDNKDSRNHRLGGRLQVGRDIELELEGGHRGNVSDHDSERRLDLRLRVTW